MASPRRESTSSFDHILKNTEFENTQQIKAIKAEREKIQAYEIQLKEKQSQIVQLEKSITGLDEHAKQLHKQFVINRDNCESLKRTATVLADHEEALKAKVKAMERQVETERLQQSAALDKYGSVWDRYETKYDSLEKSKQFKSKEMEVEKLLENNVAIELQINEVKEAIHSLKHQDDDEHCLVSMVLKIAELRVEADKNLQLVHTENEAISKLEWEIKTLQEDISQCEKLAQKQQRDQERRKQSKNVSRVVEPMEIDSTNSNRSTDEITPSLQRNENQATDLAPAVSAPNIVSTQQVQRRETITTSVAVPLKEPGLLIVQPSVKKTSNPISKYRLEMPKLCTPPRTSNRSVVGPRPPTSNVLGSSLSTPSLPAPFHRASYANTTSAISKTLPKPAMSLLHTPRPQVTLTTSNVQQQAISSTQSAVGKFTLSLKQPNTTCSRIGSLSLPPVSQPVSSTISQSHAVPVNCSVQYPLKKSQPTPRQSSSVTPNTLSQVQPSLTSIVPTQTVTRESIITNEGTSANPPEGMCTTYEQTSPGVDNIDEHLPVQSIEQNKTCQTVNTEYSSDTAGGNVTSFTGTSLFGSDSGTNDQLNNNSSYNHEVSDGLQSGNFQGGALFTDGGEAQMYYGLEGHLSGQGNQPDVSAGGTSNSFIEGFTFDQESTNIGTDNMDGGFSIFGSGDMELTKEPSEASDFSFSFGGSETANTGSFFF